MRALWSRPLAWQRLALGLAVAAAVGASVDRREIFDLRPAGYGESVGLFARGTDSVEVDPRRPDARLPYILPGPADGWAGGAAHAVGFQVWERAGRPLLLRLHAAETHDKVPPVLTVAVNGTTVKTIQTRAGHGLPPPHAGRGARSRYEVRIPPAALGPLGPGATARLSITNAAGSWIMWERVRLVEADWSLAWTHLHRRRPLTPVAAGLLAASLGSLALARARAAGRVGWPRRVASASGPALALLLLGVTHGLPAGAAAAPPRWLWIALAALLLSVGPALGWLGVAATLAAGALAGLTPLATLTAQILGSLVVVIGLPLYAGFGLTWLLRSRRLAPVLPLVAPIVGMAALSVAGHALGYLPWGTDRTIWPLLGLATAANILAWRGGARPVLGRTAALGLCGGGLALLVALLPLYQVGYLTTMGGTIDAIHYVMRAEHLRRSGMMLEPPHTDAMVAAASVAGLIRMGMRQGEVYLLALGSTLLDARPHFVFPILMGVFHAATAIGAFVLAVCGLGLNRQAAVVVGLLVAGHPLLHWAVMDTFLAHVAGVAVWGFALVAAVVALQGGGWRPVVLTGLLLALLLTFYQPYLVYLAPVAGLVAAVEWRRRVRGRPAWVLLARGLGVAVVALLAAPAGWVLAVRMFRLLGGDIGRAEITARVRGNIEVFPHPGEILGLVNHAEAAYGLGLPQLPSALASGLLAVCAGLALYGLARLPGRRRWLAAAAVLTFGVAVWHQRFWLDMGRGYPYGYFKVISLFGPFAVLLVVAGAVAAHRDAGRLPATPRRLGRLALAGLLGALFGIGLYHLAASAAFVNRARLQADRAMLELEQAVALVPDDEPLLVVDERHPGRSWLLYVLDRPALYGRERNPGYSAPPPATSDRLVRYAVVAEPERRRDALAGEPWFDRTASEVLWRNARYLLLRRTDGAVADLPLAPAGLAMELDAPVRIELSGDSLGLRRAAGGGRAFRQRLAGPPAHLELIVSGAPGSRLLLWEAGDRRALRLGTGPQSLRIPARPPMTLEVVAPPGESMRLLGVRALAGK